MTETQEEAERVRREAEQATNRVSVLCDNLREVSEEFEASKTRISELTGRIEAVS